MTEETPRRRKRRKRTPRPPSRYRIEIVRPRCTALMTCMELASRTFELDEDSIAYVLKDNGNADEDILAAAKSCTVDAILLYDRETGEKVWPPREKRFERGIGDVAADED